MAWPSPPLPAPGLKSFQRSLEPQKGLGNRLGLGRRLSQRSGFSQGLEVRLEYGLSLGLKLSLGSGWKQIWAEFVARTGGQSVGALQVHCPQAGARGFLKESFQVAEL